MRPPSAIAPSLFLLYSFFSLPRGATTVTRVVGRSETETSFGGEVSFFGFFAILLLCICPLAIRLLLTVAECNLKCQWYGGKPLEGH